MEHLERKKRLFIYGLAITLSLLSLVFLVNQINREREIRFDSLSGNASTQSSLGLSLITQIRKSLSALCWIRAGVYFHGGVTHEHEHEHTADCNHAHDHADSSDKMLNQAHADLMDEGKDYEHHHAVHKTSLFKPYRPSSKHGTEYSAEMMPWYWLTTFFDPTFVRAYANGGYFLHVILDRPQQGYEYMDQGLKSNPLNPEILQMYGWLKFRETKYDQALYYLNKIDLMHVKDRYEQRFILVLFASIYEEKEQWEPALKVWEHVYANFKQKGILKKHIRPLRKKIKASEAQKKARLELEKAQRDWDSPLRSHLKFYSY